MTSFDKIDNLKSIVVVGNFSRHPPGCTMDLVTRLVRYNTRRPVRREDGLGMEMYGKTVPFRRNVITICSCWSCR